MGKIHRDTGTTIRVWAEFKDPDTKDPLDPNSVEFRQRAPDATVVPYFYGTDAEVVRTSIGVYYVRVLLDTEGTYHWKWIALGIPGVSLVLTGDVDSLSPLDF